MALTQSLALLELAQSAAQQASAPRPVELLPLLLLLLLWHHAQWGILHALLCQCGPLP